MTDSLTTGPPHGRAGRRALAHPRRARASIALVFAVHGAVGGTFVTRIPWLQDRLDLSPASSGSPW